MKRIGNLFEKTFSPETLYSAYLDARKGKRGKRACFQFELALGANLRALHRQIHCGEYAPAEYYKFMVYEPKPRLIRAPAFRDTVVQHAIYRVIYPLFERTFIATSFACRKGFGTHRASDYAQRAMRSCDAELYTLKLDVRKFFYSIDRDILRALIARKIKDDRLLSVMMLFAQMDGPKGIPIGNLLSQIYALIYLNPVDHFIKRALAIRHYVRYVDDMVLIGLSRDECLDCRRKIVDFLKTELRLELSKSSIQKIRKGLNFVGYRTWRSKRFIRKYSLYKFRKRVRSHRLEPVVSLLGHARQTDSLPYMIKIIENQQPSLLNKLPKGYRRLVCHLRMRNGSR